MASDRQAEVFKAIQDNVSDQVTDEAMIIFGVIVAGGLLLAIAVAISKRERRKKPGIVALNHPGKLMKEVIRSVGLKQADVKRLRALVERLEESQGVEVKNPLTLMICPSLLQKAIEEEKKQAA